MTQRAAFSRQPARVILVDFRPPFDKDSCNNLTEALDHFFAVVCSLSGSCRVPFFGLLALGNYPETLFPLQQVRGRYTHLQRALSGLREFCSEDAPTDAKTADCLLQGVQDAVAMFRKQTQTLLQTAGYWGQLEVSILTSCSALSVVKHLERVIEEVNLDSLKKVQVVCLSRPGQLTLSQDISASSQGSTSEHSSSSETAGMVDFLTMDSDLLNLENFFKGWLHDCTTEREHLQLLLPASETASDNDKDKPLLIRCDLQERLISPAQLPFQAHFNLCLEGQSIKPATGAGTRGGTLNVTVHKLRVLQRCPTNSVCESVFYGQPLIVCPTSCWRLDWDELEKNKQLFTALCSHLNEKDEALLTCLENNNPPKPTGSNFSYRVPAPVPQGHFLLLASPASTLLLKSVAVRELLLPVDTGARFEMPTEQSRELMESALEQVEVGTGFNPLLVESGLYSSLTYYLTKNLPAASVPGKHKMLNLKPPAQAGKAYLQRGLMLETRGKNDCMTQDWGPAPAARNQKKALRQDLTEDYEDIQGEMESGFLTQL